MQRTIVITGATGFLGSHLLAALISRGFKVIAMTRESSSLWRIYEHIDHFISYPISQNNGFERVFSEHQVDIVVHAACNYGRRGEDDLTVISTNIELGYSLLKASIKHNVRSFLNIGSLLPAETNFYSRTKSVFSDLLALHQGSIRVMDCRIEHMYGPKDDSTKFLGWILESLDQQVAELSLTSGLQQRDFIFIDDVVSAILRLAEIDSEECGYQQYEVGTGTSTSVREFIERLLCAYEAAFGPLKTVVNFGGQPLRANEPSRLCANIQSLNGLGWFPRVSLEEGINKVIESRR